MIIVTNNYICNNVAQKVCRMQIAHLLIKFLELKCNLEDYDAIKTALQEFIDKTQYSGSMKKKLLKNMAQTGRNTRFFQPKNHCF